MTTATLTDSSYRRRAALIAGDLEALEEGGEAEADAFSRPWSAAPW
jgi:hypothetical protein